MVDIRWSLIHTVNHSLEYLNDQHSIRLFQQLRDHLFRRLAHHEVDRRSQ